MAHTNEDIITLCDRITAFCIRLNERLDATDLRVAEFQASRQPEHEMPLQTSDRCIGEIRPPPLPDPDPPYNPTVSDFLGSAPLQRSLLPPTYHQPAPLYNRASIYQSDWYHPPPDPDPPYALPAYANHAVDHPFYITFDAAAPPLHEPDRRMGVFAEMESHLSVVDRRMDSLRPPDLPEPEPPLTAALPHQNYLQMPPPKTYQPPPLPSILDCDRVATGFDAVEKVEKMKKSSQDSAHKEKPVQGSEEIGCSRQSSHHDHPQQPSCLHRCSATAPHSVVAAVPPPPQAAITATCSPDRIDTLSPASEALECMPTGSDNWTTAYISDVNALMIYWPRRLRILGILGVHEVDSSAINALATLRLVWTNFGSIVCRKVEPSLGNFPSSLISWLSVVIVFIDCRKYCVFDPGGLADKGAIMGIDEETFRLSGLELIDGVVLINQCVICASIKDWCWENGSIGNVKKVVASFNDARVSSYDAVEDDCVKQGGVSPSAFLGDKIAYGLPQDWMKIASLYVGLYVSINHRSSSFDTDAQLIPPHTDMLCLNIFGHVDELPILALHCSEPLREIMKGDAQLFGVHLIQEEILLLLILFVASWFPP